MLGTRWIPGLLCAHLLVAQQGEVSGQVRVTSTLTKRRISLPQVYDRTSAIPVEASRPPDVTAELKRVVLYIDSAGLASQPAKITVDQRQRHFEPDVVAVPVGSTIVFPNSDPIFHNVFSLSKPRPFDLGNYKQGESRAVTFPQPGIVQVHCHLHPNMSAAIVVTPNSWWTQPTADGKFKLPPLAPGRYTLVAWHKSAGAFRRRIEVKAGQATEVDFEIPLTDMARR